MRDTRWLSWLLLAFVALSLGRVALTHWLPQDEAQPERTLTTSMPLDPAHGDVGDPPAAPAEISSTGRVSEPASRVDAVAVRTPEPRPQPLPTTGAPADPPGSGAGTGQVVVYYFHGTVRCKTCLAIEGLTREAEAEFAAELAAGRLDLQVVNLDDPKHEHFVEDYQLSTRCVVLSRRVKDKEREFRRLDWVWDRVHEPEIFLRDMKSEIRALLEIRD